MAAMGADANSRLGCSNARNSDSNWQRGKIFDYDKRTPVRGHLQLLFGFVLGFLMALATLLFYDRFLLQTEQRRQRSVATEHWQTGYMTALQEVAVEAGELQRRLNDEVRLLCMVLTSPAQHASRAAAVRATWGKRCSKLIFWSSERDEELGAVPVVEPEADVYDNLWNKTREGFRYAYEQHFENYDWFLKADDDTYVVMENLRFLLYGYYPETPIYFGYKLVRYEVPYMSGGAAYVLSKAALRHFMRRAYHNTTLCPPPHKYGIEDFYMGICLQNAGVHLADARYALAVDTKPKFMPLDLRTYLAANASWDVSNWLVQMTPHPIELGIGCCSNYSIAFHYTDPQHMFVYEFLIYHQRAFGLQHRDVQLPVKMSSAEVARRFPSNYSENGNPVVDLHAQNLPDNF